MLNKKFFDLTSMAEAIKKNAQREIEDFDEPYMGMEDEEDQMEEYDLETGEPTARDQNENLGFSPFEISEIEFAAIEMGLKGKSLKLLSTMLDYINKEIDGGYKSKGEARVEIKENIDHLLQSQKSQRRELEPPMEMLASSLFVNKNAQGQVVNEPTISARDIQNIEQYCKGKGLHVSKVQEVAKIIGNLNTRILSGEIEKQDAMQDILEHINNLLENQKAQPVMVEPTTDVMVQTTDEIPPPQDEPKTPATEIKNVEKPGMLPETEDQYQEEDVSKYPIAYEKGGRVMAKQNIFRVTPQTEKMLDVFGKENLVSSPLFGKAVNWVNKVLKSAYFMEQGADISEIKAILYRNLMNALSVRERYDPRSGETERGNDYRIKFFIDAPSLIPVELTPQWENIQQSFDTKLKENQTKWKPTKKWINPPTKLYDVTKEEIINQSGISKQLILALNKLVNSGDPRILEPIYKEAAHLTAYEIGHRERGDKQMPTATVGEDAEEKDISELGLPSTKEKVEGPAIVDIKDNQRSFGTTAKIIGYFMDDVWENISSRTLDPKAYLSLEKVRLRAELLKQQSKKLFNPGEKSNKTTKKEIYNDDGIIVWNRPPKKVKIKNEMGVIEDFTIDTQFSDIVKPEAFYKYYMQLLDMKLDIQRLAQGKNINTENLSAENINLIKQEAEDLNPVYSSEAFQSFLSDPEFIKMTIAQKGLIEAEKKKFTDQQKTETPVGVSAPTETTEEKKQRQHSAAMALDYQFQTMWPALAADSLMAVAKGIVKRNQELKNPNLTEQQKKMLKSSFEAARRNYLTLIGYHTSYFDPNAHKKDKKTGKPIPVKFKKLDIMGIDIDVRAALEMIAGYRPIPQEIIDKSVASKYPVASRIYNNMLSKVAKLMRIRRDTIKLASSSATIDSLIQRTIRDDIRRIRKIMR